MFGAEHAVGNQVTAKTRLNLSDNAELNMAMITQFNENTKFVYSERFILNNLFDWSDAKFNFGVKFEYSL